METYEESVRSVDAALRRLNATLASYNMPSKQSANSSGAAKADDTKQNASNTSSANAAKGTGQKSSSTKKSTQPAEKDDQFGPPMTPEEQKAAVWRDIVGLRAHQQLTEIQADDWQVVFEQLTQAFVLQAENPYCVPLYIVLSGMYLQLGYPDLAAGEAYKALLLSDAVKDTSDEFHEQAFESLRSVISQVRLEERIALLKKELGTSLSNAGHEQPDEEQDVELDIWLREHYLPLIYRMLGLTLWGCGSYRSAYEFTQRALELYPNDYELQAYNDNIVDSVADHFEIPYDDFPGSEQYRDLTSWPDEGFVRREEYPWNDFEVDRLSNLKEINEWMQQVAPKLELKPARLEALNGLPEEYTDDGFVTQLGVFAKEDCAPGEVILNETSYLCVNNKLQSDLCDACSSDLPDLIITGPDGPQQCTDCEVVFCSSTCYDKAMELYHPAVCDREVESIAKDGPATKSADNLYALLLLRVLAMAEEQGKHPLEIPEVKFIWADFHPFKPVSKRFKGYKFLDPHSHSVPLTLNWSFEYNVRLPYHMLEKMDIDFYADPRFNVWVFNTLYAKFRGTASARLSGRDHRQPARGPEVCAVHPMWCMANHDCDPNVSWEWGSSIQLTTRTQRQKWEHRAGLEEYPNKPGIKKGEQILNHYCDPELDVYNRRRWAEGALGGSCQCRRCSWESWGHKIRCAPRSDKKREKEVESVAKE